MNKAMQERIILRYLVDDHKGAFVCPVGLINAVAQDSDLARNMASGAVTTLRNEGLIEQHHDKVRASLRGVRRFYDKVS